MGKVNRKGETNPNWHGGMKTLQCFVCGSEFSVIPSRAEKAKCCSLACWNKHQKTVKRGPKSEKPSIPNEEFIGPVRKRGQRSFKSILARLKEYSREVSTGCIEWQKRRNEYGYGTISYRSKSWLAHRLKWTLERSAIPEGMNVCHTCDNPACINIEHLFLGTQADNVSDMMKKGRGFSPGNPGEKHHNATLSADDVAYIRRELANRKHGKDGTNGHLARKFGVSEAVISNINKDRRWKTSE